jgi:hypothetical protein
MLLSLVVDKLLIGLNEGIYNAVGYAGNTAVLIKRKFTNSSWHSTTMCDKKGPSKIYKRP